jgi:hypothetical protein
VQRSNYDWLYNENGPVAKCRKEILNELRNRKKKILFNSPIYKRSKRKN